MLGFSPSFNLRKRDQSENPTDPGKDARASPEDMTPAAPRNSRSSKRNSGFFDIGYTQMAARTQGDPHGGNEAAGSAAGVAPGAGGGVQRRTSKRASSQDRHGHVYGIGSTPIRSTTPDRPSDAPTDSSPPLARHNLLDVSPHKTLLEPASGTSNSNDNTGTNNDASVPATHWNLSAGPPQIPKREASDPSRSSRDVGPRPRTRTMEETIRSRSPQTSRADIRKRIGSFQSVSHLPLQQRTLPGGSIGYPSIIGTASQGLIASPTSTTATATPSPSTRTRVGLPSPRAVSPGLAGLGQVPPPISTSATAVLPEVSPPPANAAAANANAAAAANATTTTAAANRPQTDAERILALMRDTSGRMHGMLYFRFAKIPTWQSGFCAINASTGTLIYQTKGELAQTKTLIPDLRGCKVRTQTDPDGAAPFLEMSTKASGFSIHLRPLVPETFESWLAALLYWQPVRATGPQRRDGISSRPRTRRTPASKPPSGTATPPTTDALERVSSRATLRSKQSIDYFAAMRGATILKTAKVLWWDPAAPQSSVLTPARRVSTYKQQRMAAGPPWRKAVVSIRENGLFEVLLEGKDREGNEEAQNIAATVDLSCLKRYAVQRLHPSVLDDEFSLAVFGQYTAAKKDQALDDIDEDDEPGIPWPVYLSFESRTALEAWYVLFRSYTVPELYGADMKLFEPMSHPASKSAVQAEVPKDTFRLKRNLFLRVVEAHLHATRPVGQEPIAHSRDGSIVGDYHAEIHIDGDVRGRTSIQHDTSNPFWRNDYDFNHLAPFISTVTVVVKSRQAGQRDWILVSDHRVRPEDIKDANHLEMVEDIHISPLDTVHGTIELDIGEITRGIESEQWYTLLNEYDEPTGRILLRTRIDETVILLNDEYKELNTLLHAFSNGLATEAVEKCTEKASYIPQTLLNIFQVNNTAGRWISTMVEDEIDGLQRDVSASRYRFSRRIASNDSYDSGVERELVLRDLGKTAYANAGLLFRGNTALTKALELHMRRLGKEYLEDILGERLRDIDESDPECEVDPNRVRNPEALQRNWRNLILLTESIWRSIRTSANAVPPELRQIFRTIRSCTEDRYGVFLRTVAYSSVSAFLFLRLIVPAILSPSLFGLLKEVPRLRSRRTLTLIAKSLQSLANMTTFGTKEPWMEPMNAFLNGHRQEFKEFIDEVCAISQERVSQPPAAPRDFVVPLRVLDQLPPPSKEGYPSLPYLIDKSQELAILVNAWMDSRGDAKPETEELSKLDNICSRIRLRTREVLLRVAEKEPEDSSGTNWKCLLRHLDQRGKTESRRGSRVTSPVASPNPSHDEHNAPSDRTNLRSQPGRPTATPSSLGHKSSMSETHLRTLVNASSENSTRVSPSQRSFFDTPPEAAEEQSPTGSNEDTSTGYVRDRIASITSGPGGYIHPLAWGDPGSAGSGRSKASSLQSLDIRVANFDFAKDESGALPLTDGLSPGGSEVPGGSSPAASPRDPSETNRFFGKLSSFGRRDRNKNEKERKEEQDDAQKKARRKEEKRKEKEEKETKRFKDRAKERGTASAGNAGSSNGGGSGGGLAASSSQEPLDDPRTQYAANGPLS